MKQKYLSFLFICIAATACNTNTTSASKSTADKQYSTVKTEVNDQQNANDKAGEIADSIRHATINRLKVANQNDPVCDMSLIRGFEDTTCYKGKVLGFCSKDCKDAFLKKPTGYKIKYK